MRELLFSLTRKDFKIDYFSGSGAGGQHRNKHQNCVRIFHPASGARATGQSSKSRAANMKQALHGLAESVNFKMWYTRVCNEIFSGETIEERVDKEMKNIRIEGRETGKWETIGG